MKGILRLAFLGLGLFSISAFGQVEKSTANKEITIFEAIQASPRHTIFTKGLIKTGLDKLLSGEVNYIVFAPSDDSFQGKEGLVANLFDEKNEDYLLRVWSRHIIKSSLEPEQVQTLSIGTADFKKIKLTNLMDEDYTIGKQGKAFVLKPGNEQDIMFMPQEGSCKNGLYYSVYDFVLKEN